ncbi:MAG TPA: hypothetical protein VLZ83_00280 [Edaphocola sp.]|nr:hypothetical protein [Edaphocola sp.]
MKFLFYIIFLCLGFQVKAQFVNDSLSLNSAKAFNIDELNNIYIIQQDNSLVVYNLNGNIIATYQNIQDGDLSIVDARNPLKVLLYFPDFSKLIFLDRMMSIKSEISLNDFGFFNVNNVALSSDGKIWLFDEDRQQLIKIDELGNFLYKSDDIRSLIRQHLNPIGIVESDGMVYIINKDSGVYVFDLYANYLNHIILDNYRTLQVYHDILLYAQGNDLKIYQLKDGVTKSINFSSNQKFIDAKIGKGYLFLLFENYLQLIDLK